MDAVEHGNEEAVRLLLEWGADPINESYYRSTSWNLSLVNNGAIRGILACALQTWA
jgi:ankyrin repeat protein